MYHEPRSCFGIGILNRMDSPAAKANIFASSAFNLRRGWRTVCRYGHTICWYRGTPAPLALELRFPLGKVHPQPDRGTIADMTI